MKRALTITVLTAWGIAATAFTGVTGSQGITLPDPTEAVAPLGPRHNHEGLTWPPQPRGITNVVIHSNLEQEIKDRLLEKARMDRRLERIATTNPEVIRALGQQFTRITVIEKEDKTNGRVVSQMVFFSRDRNATVEVDFDDEEIRAVNSLPPWDYQPEITDEEVTEAAALARTYFLNQGRATIAGLNAYGILAYQPEGVGFFGTRVLYVSFHQHEDAPPEFAAWVDLTNQLILKTREEP